MVNVRALAVPQNPHLQTRGRGHITHQCDEGALQKFIADNYDALNRPVARRKRVRESGVGTSTCCLLATNKDWLK